MTNIRLVGWLSTQCEKIAKADTGIRRYRAYKNAADDLECNAAPLTGGCTAEGWWYDKDEKIMCLQALYWAALAAGMKQDTADRVYTGCVEMV
jgi:hypothetical protein